MKVLSIQDKELNIYWSFVVANRDEGEIFYSVRGVYLEDGYCVEETLELFDDVVAALDYSDAIRLQIKAEREQQKEEIPFYG